MNDAHRVKVDGRDAGFAEVIPPKGKEDPVIAMVSQLMDSAFYVPGTKIRFGLDPVIGLVPGVGDSAGTLVSVALIGMSARYGIPKIVLARMALNAAINGVVGSVPFAGDAFSIWFKSNKKNYELLKTHAESRAVSTRGHWLFVAGLIAAVLLIVGLSLAVTITLWLAVFSFVFGH